MSWLPMRRRLPWLLVTAIVVIVVIGWGSSGFSTIFQANVPNCGLQAAAFCDQLNKATVNGPDVRSGGLDGVVWGVSRGTSGDDPSQGAYQAWQAPHATICGTLSNWLLPTDVNICNGNLYETTNDGGQRTTLAMYPRQPFDIAGRTGIVAFDLSADGLCNHCAWPTFEYTDQPVPAPMEGTSVPRNGFGFSLWSVGACSSTTQEGVGDMWIVTNYKLQMFGHTGNGCVTSGMAGGPLNHFEVRLSPSHVEVWGTDAGQSTLKQMAVADVALPLTRGLVWMVDDHYNANKDSTQGTHTFEWGNFGFDGPVLPRDLGFDVQNATNDGSIGYLCRPTCNVTVNRVSGIAAASNALLEFTWTSHQVDTLQFAVNGNPAHNFPWPYADQQAFTLRTIAMPFPPGELVSGTNHIVVSSAAGDTFDIANIDVILVGAGGGGSVPPTQAATSVPPTIPPAATALPTSVPATPAPPATATVVPVVSTCAVNAVLNATPTTFTRPMAFCVDQ